jgi:hypothetical protein
MTFDVMLVPLRTDPTFPQELSSLEIHLLYWELRMAGA